MNQLMSEEKLQRAIQQITFLAQSVRAFLVCLDLGALQYSVVSQLIHSMKCMHYAAAQIHDNV